MNVLCRCTHHITECSLKLLPHDLGVAYHGSSLVYYSVTYLEYKTACRVVYAIPLSHVSDIRELAMAFAIICQRIIFQKLCLIFMGKMMLTQCIN